MSRSFGAWWISPFLVLGLVGAASARVTIPPGSGVPPTIRYFERVRGFSSNRPAQGGAAARRGTASSRLEVSFRTLGRNFDLELEPNDLFAPGAVNLWVGRGGTLEEEPKAAFYRGRLKNEPNSWVRVSVRNGVVDGVVTTPDEMYFVEPAERFFRDAAPGEMLAYRLSDTDSDWTPGSCATESLPKHGRGGNRHARRAEPSGTAAYQELSAALQQAAAESTLQRAQVGIVADYEYFQKWGANAATKMQDVMNQVDGVYQAEVGVNLQVSKTVVFTSSNDPFSDTNDPNTLLNEFSTYKNNNDNSTNQALYGTDLAHLFTGRDLSGSVIGIAWLGSLCSSFYGSGLSQDFTTNNKSLVLLTAHELGHNFGAPHDNQSGSACGTEPWGYIMNPSLSSDLALQFSGCSKSKIASEVGASSSCLDTVTGGGSTPTPTLTPTPTPTVAPNPVLNPPAAPIVVGGTVTLTGSGFTAGSVIKAFVATASGPLDTGAFAPSSRTSTSLVWQVSPSIPLGQGFVTLLVINTDQNYAQSNSVSQLLYGAASLNIPTIMKLNGVSLRPPSPSIPLANVETVIAKGSTLTIEGTGFNRPLVNLFTSAGKFGPLSPLPGGTSTSFQVNVPADVPTGPGSLQVVNGPYTGNVVSNAVSVPLGSRVTVSNVSQVGSTITVTGTGFSTMTVINLFNGQGVDFANLGGLSQTGNPMIPLTLISDTQFSFQVPAGAMTGAAYVQVLNPPFIPFSTSGSDPDGGFYLVAP
jgi:hypothetical protein